MQSDAYQESHGAANLARPSVTDCEVARTVLADIHGSSRERQLLRMYGDAELSLQTFAWGWGKPGQPPVGYGGAGSDGDWRWCSGLGRYVRSIGWVRLGNVLSQRSTVYFTRPAYSAARDKAVVFESAMPDSRAPDWLAKPDERSAFAGRLIFLERNKVGDAWKVVGDGRAS